MGPTTVESATPPAGPAVLVPPSAPTRHAGRAEQRRNHRLGVLNGALYMAGEGFIDSTTVIPVFVSRLTSSSALIGLCSSLSDLGWFLPQFAVAPWVARFPRLLWLYRRAAVVRALGLGTLAILTILLAPTHPGLLLAAFLVAFGAYSFGAGVAAIPFFEVVSKTIPRERLGAFWAQRLFWGGLLAAAAGVVVREAARIPNAGTRYALLFGLAMVLVSVAYGLFSAIREPAGPPGQTADTPLGQLRVGGSLLLHDASFRRLFVARSALSMWLTSSPFMVVFAVRDLGGGARATGTFLLARVTGMVISNLAWQRLSRRHGNRALMKLSAVGCSATSLAAAAIAVASPWSLGWLTAGSSVTALEVVAFAGGAIQSAALVGFSSLVIELAPPGQRHSFVSLMNTFIGATMLLPTLGGALVDWFNAPTVFALCALLAVFGHRAASGLPDRVDGGGAP